MDSGFAFIKMSNKWYCIPYKDEFDFREKMEDNFQHHIANGDIVALADDVESFVRSMGIKEEDVVMVDDADTDDEDLDDEELKNRAAFEDEDSK